MPEGTSEMDALLILIFALSISINLSWACWAAATSTRHEASRAPAAKLLTTTMKRFNSQPTAGSAAINRG
jgi:hypothetical protein